MKLFIPYAEIGTELDDNGHLHQFQCTAAMIVAIDHFFKPEQSISLRKSIESSFDNSGLGHFSASGKPDTILKRIELQVAILERFIKPMFVQLGLSDNSEVARMFKYEIIKQDSSGFIIDIQLTTHGQVWSSLSRGY